MPEIDLSSFISQSAINRFARTIVQYAVGVGVAFLIAHNIPISAAQEGTIVTVGGGALVAVLSYVQRRYLDHLNIPGLNALRPPEHPLVTLQKAANGPVTRNSDPGDTDLPPHALSSAEVAQIAADPAPAVLAAVPDVAGKDISKPVVIGPDGKPE